VYFFFEDGEERRDSGSGPRVVRVGTHALKAGSRSSLWGRLSQHRGTPATGGGNHRGSIFRLHVGTAIVATTPALRQESWGVGLTAKGPVREAELVLEQAVSSTIGKMRILWLAIDDAPGPLSARGDLERNSIGLLSNLGKAPIDPPTSGWLGYHSRSAQVRGSGLWNVNHVNSAYDPTFLDRLEAMVEQTA
jgi:hypothetical protein